MLNHQTYVKYSSWVLGAAVIFGLTAAPLVAEGSDRHLGATHKYSPGLHEASLKRAAPKGLFTRDRIASPQVDQIKVSPDGKAVTVKMTIHGKPVHELNGEVVQGRFSSEFTVKPGQEYLLGKGSGAGNRVYLRANKSGKVSIRQQLKGRGEADYANHYLRLQINEDKTVPLSDRRVLIHGQYQPVNGNLNFGTGALGKRGFTVNVDQNSLTKRINDREGRLVWKRTLSNVFRSIDGKQIKADAMTFNHAVPTDQPSVMNLGSFLVQKMGKDIMPYFISHKVHLNGTKITHVSLVETYHP